MLSGCFKSVESLSLHYRPYMLLLVFMFVRVCSCLCMFVVRGVGELSEIFVAVCNLYQC